MSVPGLIIYLLLLFRTGLLIYNEEKFISAFYEALRKRYRYSYVKPNKVIQTVRKLYGLEKSKSIHWVICFFHYLQIAQVFFTCIYFVCPIVFFGRYGYTFDFFDSFSPTGIDFYYVLSVYTFAVYQM